MGPDDAKDPSATRLGEHFKQNYKVGDEEIGRDIPTVILLRLLTSALLVTRNWLMAALPGGASLKKQPLYRLLLDYPLRIAHAIAGYLSRVPQSRRLVLSGILAICVAALVIGVKWFDPIVAHSGQLHLLAFGFFLLFPAVVLIGAAVLLVGKKLPRAGVLKWTAAVVGALALLWGVLLLVPISIVAHEAVTRSIGCTANGPWYCAIFRSEALSAGHLAVVYLVLPLLAAFAGGALITWLTRYAGPSHRDMTKCMTGMLQTDLRGLATCFGAASSLPSGAEMTEADRRKIAVAILAAVKKDKERKNALQRELRRLNPLGLPVRRLSARRHSPGTVSIPRFL